MGLLQDEDQLKEIVRLVGQDSLSDPDQLKLFTAKSLREDFLQQNAFDEVDTYCSMEKQYAMLGIILSFYDEALKALDKGVYLSEIESMEVNNKISRMRYVEEDKLPEIKAIQDELQNEFRRLIAKRED